MTAIQIVQAQVWPHLNASEESFRMPRMFRELNRTNHVWGLSSGGFQVGVATSKDTYVFGEPVQALVQLKNLVETKGWARRVYEQGAMTSVELVLLERGKLVPSRYQYVKAADYVGRSSGRVVVLEPGESLFDGVRLDLQFVLEANKEYHFYAIRHAARGREEYEVTSGTCSFRVTGKMSQSTNASSPPHSPNDVVSSVPKSAVLTEPVTARSRSVSQGTAPPKRVQGNALQNQTNAIVAAAPLATAAASTGHPNPDRQWAIWLVVGLLGLVAGILLNAARRQRGSKAGHHH